MPPKAAATVVPNGSASSSTLMHTYFFYSAILALKLLFLKPLACIVCCPEKVQRAHISDLKNLTPFWLVAALYMTTSPDATTARALLRIFVAARFVAAYGYIYCLPRPAKEWAFFVSFCISCFMGMWAMYAYRSGF